MLEDAGCVSTSGITIDNLYEPTESFTLFLELDPFVMQSGILIQPNVTEVFILDGSGKSVVW